MSTSPAENDQQHNKTSPAPTCAAATSIRYRPVPVVFRKDGFGYRQMKRVGDLAIYDQQRSGVTRAFEVVRIRRRDGFRVGETVVGPMEVYPTSEKWGADGWTLPTLAAAEAKLTEISATA